MVSWFCKVPEHCLPSSFCLDALSSESALQACCHCSHLSLFPGPRKAAGGGLPGKGTGETLNSPLCLGSDVPEGRVCAELSKRLTAMLPLGTNVIPAAAHEAEFPERTQAVTERQRQHPLPGHLTWSQVHICAEVEGMFEDGGGWEGTERPPSSIPYGPEGERWTQTGEGAFQKHPAGAPASNFLLPYLTGLCSQQQDSIH